MNQPENVRCDCLQLLAKQQSAQLKFDPIKVSQTLLFNFNWVVRKNTCTKLDQNISGPCTLLE